MNRPSTLRGRLAAAMLLIFLLALGASTTLDWVQSHGRAGAPAQKAWDGEPFQDGLVLALFSLPALALIWLVSSWSLRPLTRASEEARAAGPRDPAARISRDRLPAEIAPLVDAVNGALDRMANAVEAERRFTENAAHELRTPLAILGLRLQRAQQGGRGAVLDWPAIDRDLAQMNRLVHQLLDLARKEHAGRMAGSQAWPVVNLSRIAREAAALVLPLAEAQSRDLVADLPETLAIRGEADDLRDALCNLLENAAIHGRGTIGLKAGLSGASAPANVVLVVSDEGAGFPPALRGAAFERFHKASHSEGSGLGLAIVREVVRSHGGEVVILPGPGCRLQLTLPAAGPNIASQGGP